MHTRFHAEAHIPFRRRLDRAAGVLQGGVSPWRCRASCPQASRGPCAAWAAPAWLLCDHRRVRSLLSLLRVGCRSARLSVALTSLLQISAPPQLGMPGMPPPFYPGMPPPGSACCTLQAFLRWGSLVPYSAAAGDARYAAWLPGDAAGNAAARIRAWKCVRLLWAAVLVSHCSRSAPAWLPPRDAAPGHGHAAAWHDAAAGDDAAGLPAPAAPVMAIFV